MYTIKQASSRSGVTIPLLRAWERRYGVVSPTRTPAGYRLYDDEAITRLRAMRRLVDAGWSAATAADAIVRGEAPVTDDVAGPARSPRAGGEGSGVDPDALARAAATYDAATVEAALDDLFARGSFEAVIDDLVLPAVAALGTAWVNGTLDIGGEHLASAAVLRRLAERFDHAGSIRSGEPVIVGLPAGARHEVGALAFAVALRRRGADVLYLGPDVPAMSWADAARERAAAVAVIGIPRADDVRAGLAAVAAIERGHPGTRAAFGGPGARLDPEAIDVASRGGVVLLSERVVEAAAEVVALLASPRRA